MSRRIVAPNTTAEKLREELEGTLRFIWRHNGGTDEQSARRRAIETVNTLKQHLIELGVEPSLTRSLDDIYMAFAEAKRGRQDPLFAPKPLGHRPPD